MAATLLAMREGLRTQLEKIAGLRAYAVWPAKINPPVALVRPERELFHTAMGSPGHSTSRFEVTVLSMALQKDLERAQRALDDYLNKTGAKSVKAAIEADKTLGGEVVTLTVLGWRDYGVLVVNAIEYAGAIFDVEVIP